MRVPERAPPGRGGAREPFSRGATRIADAFEYGEVHRGDLDGAFDDFDEIGVDPGIDHMSAMKVIDRVKAEGGRITSFIVCPRERPSALDASVCPWLTD